MDTVATKEIFYRFAVALLIGLLVGMQREYAHLKRSGGDSGNLFAGMRTFALFGLVGCSAAYLSDIMASPWIMVGVLLVSGALLAVSHYVDTRKGFAGLTSEVSVLITLLAGALCYYGYVEIAAAVAVTVTVVLAIKNYTESLLQKITLEDIYATLKFAVITVIILPILPSDPIAPAPFDVLVPYKIWLMVCLISGISFLGYILIKIVGSQKGIGLVGILGGLASSTAVTLTFAQRSKDIKGLETSFALAILLAWLVMFIRVLVEVAVVNEALIETIWKPITFVTLVTLAYCYYLHRKQSKNSGEQDAGEFTNPFKLGPAIKFGFLYGLILVVANVARIKFGDEGVYISALVSGLVDVDAITLSMAELSRNPEELSQQTAAKAIVIAATSNTLVKGGIVLSAGSKELRKVILPGLLVVVVSAVISLSMI